jgi:hypothetical protein
LVACHLFTFGLASLTFLPLDDLEKAVEELCTEGNFASVGDWAGDRQAGDAPCVVCTLRGVQREELAVHGIDDLFERDGTNLGPRRTGQGLG